MFRYFLVLFALALLWATAVRAQAPSPTPAGYLPPKVITRAPVSYPEAAHLNRIEGVVRVKFFIDDTGHIANALVAKKSSSVMLDDMVRERGIREWVFQPATLDGKPVPSTFEQEFEFRLDPAEERRLAIKRLALPVGTPDPPYPPEAKVRALSGEVKIGVHWTEGEHAGLVDQIYLIKSSGSGLLDNSTLRYVYENWRIDPAVATKAAYVKTIKFKPPQ